MISSLLTSCASLRRMCATSASIVVLGFSAAANAEPLEVGVTTNVTLGCGATETMTIAGNAGDFIRIDTVELQDLGGGGGCPAACAFDQRVRLYTPDGSLLAERTTGIQGNCCSASCRLRTSLTALLDETGEYTLELRDQNLSGRGVIAVTAQVLNAPVGESVLTSGASLVVALDQPGRFETTHIDVPAGTPVGITMEVLSGGVLPRLTLYHRTSGQLLAISNDGAISGVIAPESGLTLCSNSAVDQTGVYQLNVATVNACTDLDGDGEVGLTDLLTLLNSWGPCR